jgi:hypothetical protein
MLGASAAGQNAGMQLRVKRLDAAVEDFREARRRLDRHDRDARASQRFGRSSGRDDLEAPSGEALGQLHDAVLAVNGDEGAPLAHGLSSGLGSVEDGGSGGASFGSTSLGGVWRVRSPRACRHSASHVAAMPVTARE